MGRGGVRGENPRRVERGKFVYANDINRLMDALISRITVGPGIEMRRGGNGISLSLTNPYVPSHPTLRQFEVQSEADDHLVCLGLEADGSTTISGNVLVMKPMTLRGSVTGSYAEGDVIYAYEMNVYLSAGGTLTKLIDANVDARGSSKDYALLVLKADQSISAGSEQLISFLAGGFSSTGDLFSFSSNRIKVARDAQVRIRGQVGIRDNGDEEAGYVRAWVRGPTTSSLPRQIGSTIQGVDNQILPFGAVASHGHESPAGGSTVRYLNFGGRLSLSADDTFGIAVIQRNVNNATWYATADEFGTSVDTWIEAEEV